MTRLTVAFDRRVLRQMDVGGVLKVRYPIKKELKGAYNQMNEKIPSLDDAIQF